MLFLIKLILLALIQGVGEILPISSSGHLIMFSNLCNINDEGVTIEILLHVASLLALVFYYFDFIKDMIKGVYKYLIKKDYTCYKKWNYFSAIIIASIPVCLVGFILNDYLDLLVNYVGLFLIFNGILLLFIKNRDTNREVEDLRLLDKLKIGLFETIGLVPGISRSGSSLLGCSVVKLNKEDSFNLTFLLLFPLVLGSLVLNVGEFSYDKALLIPYIIIFLITFMVTYLSMVILHKLVITRGSKIFSVYCVSVGVIYSIILLVI